MKAVVRVVANDEPLTWKDLNSSSRMGNERRWEMPGHLVMKV